MEIFNLQPFLNCGYMNTCFKCGQKFLCKGHKDQFSTFETCIHRTGFETLLYFFLLEEIWARKILKMQGILEKKASFGTFMYSSIF
jgi:hypothetical protein